ncbi:hypothetical protein Scep_016678 [Stephania cephalantha]|uniref:Uncharacterized protein n=1 Tax=Stephania cephalantha TaxID=152367 RepID=A0AAP0NUW6_9MAGN
MTYLLHLSLTHLSDSPSPTSPHDDAHLCTELRDLLHQFLEVFDKPYDLPPSPPTDHQIPLIPGYVPINVKPYRYPQFQKNEIKLLVKEMLEYGVIRPSTSPFSTPILLVKKKDGS